MLSNEEFHNLLHMVYFPIHAFALAFSIALRTDLI